MGILPVIDAATEELTEIFKDLHQHPEIGFTETRTAKVVAEKLRAYGVDEVHEGIAKTGVVALIKGKSDSGRRVGLRADMDALPIHEETNLPYSSKSPGVMHACGHDGHTTMLLGAANTWPRRAISTAPLFDLPTCRGRTGRCAEHAGRRAVRQVPL